MGSLIERAIEMGISGLVKQDVEKARMAIVFDTEIDEQEKAVEALCMKLLLQQQPVAKDLRLISAALKMITDMERIGDHAADISEMTILMADSAYERSELNIDLVESMAKETTDMVIKSVDAFVNKDLELARKVIAQDDVVDDLFAEFENSSSSARSVKMYKTGSRQPICCSWQNILSASATMQRILPNGSSIRSPACMRIKTGILSKFWQLL